MKSGKLINRLKQLLTATMVVGSCLFYGGAQAVDGATRHEPYRQSSRNDKYSHKPVYQTDIRSRPSMDRWAQNKNRNFRSKREVINEVKRRYDATVLKINLNDKRAVYNVRILMPNGKVKSIQVSAVR